MLRRQRRSGPHVFFVFRPHPLFSFHFHSPLQKGSSAVFRRSDGFTDCVLPQGRPSTGAHLKTPSVSGRPRHAEHVQSPDTDGVFRCAPTYCVLPVLCCVLTMSLQVSFCDYKCMPVISAARSVGGDPR